MAGENNSTAQMSPEELQAAMAAIVAHEIGAAPTASVTASGATSDATPALNEEDRTANAVAEQYQKDRAQAAAEQARRDAMNPAARKYEDIKGLLPEPMRQYFDDAALGAAGYLGGRMLRSNIEPQYRYGTPEYKTRQAHLDTAGEVNAVADQSRAAITDAAQQHAATAQALQANANNLAAQHAAAEQALQQAEEDHRYHSSRSPSAEAEAHLQGVERQVRGNEGQGSGGNTGRANQTGYNTRTAQEAARAQATASTLGSMGLNPTRVFAEAPDLASTPSGILFSKEEALRQEEARMAQQRELNQRRDAIAQQVAQEKADAAIRLERARTAERDAKAALVQEMQRLQKHVATPPLSDTAQLRHQENIARANSLQAELPGRGQKAMEFIGKKILPKYAPGLGAAFAPLEIAQAKKDWEQGNYLRAAAHGAGGVGGLAQATGIPWLMGAGDILQTPAAGLALYDFMQNPAAAR